MFSLKKILGWTVTNTALGALAYFGFAKGSATCATIFTVLNFAIAFLFVFLLACLWFLRKQEKFTDHMYAAVAKGNFQASIPKSVDILYDFAMVGFLVTCQAWFPLGVYVALCFFQTAVMELADALYSPEVQNSDEEDRDEMIRLGLLVE